MPDDLRRKLGRAQVRRRRSSVDGFDPDAWARTIEYYQKHGGIQENRCPVVIGGRSIITSPEMLQDLAGLPEVPKVSATFMVNTRNEGPIIAEGQTEPEVIHICDVFLSQLNVLRSKTERHDDVCVRFEDTSGPRPGFALVALALKDNDSTNVANPHRPHPQSSETDTSSDSKSNRDQDEGEGGSRA